MPFAKNSGRKPSLPEAHRSISVPNGKSSWRKEILSTPAMLYIYCANTGLATNFPEKVGSN